ncbi:MAG TPA: VWA domain-containing protein [Blastocatellia bacterium]|nr:VWA domain-containing protein [Blastocatellia bacterium]
MKLYLFLLLALFPLAAQTQDKPQPKPQPTPSDDQTIRIETQVVQLDVTVTDKQGKVIRDLKREDFELREDGKVQDIAYFSVGTATRPARWLGTDKPSRKDATTITTTTTTPPPTEALAGRYIVLALDDLHLSAATLLQARQSLTKFVEQQVGSGDQVALFTTSGQLGMFQQFTNDRDILKRAINRLSVQERQVTSSFDVPRITPHQAEMIDMGDQDALELAVQEILRQQSPGGVSAANSTASAGGGRGGRGAPAPPGGGMSERERAMETARSLARMIVMQNAHYTTATLTTLQLIIRTLSALPGRKVMTLVSDGFFLNARSANTLGDLRRVVDAATRAGVVIYAIDARGLYTSPIFDASQPSYPDDQMPGVRERVENSGMEALRNGPFALANDTGGFMVMNTNDLNLGFQRVLQDTEAYYLLAFEPVESYRDGRFRKLEVRVKNHPEYKVRSSKGYFASDEKAEAKAAEKEEKERVKLVEEREKNPEKAAKKEAAAKNTRAWEALGSLFPLRGIPVEMSVDFVDSGKGISFALITAHFDVAGLKFDQVKGQYTATVEVLGSVFDEKGKPVDGFSQRLNMNLPPATYERVLQSGLVFTRRVALKPGFYQVRLAALREGNKQTGSASDWVEVSDISKKQLVLSSIFLTTEKETNYLLAQMDRKNNPSAATQEPAPVPTQVARRFKPGAKFDFSIFAYNAKPDSKGVTDLVVQSQIFSGSKVIYASPLAKMESPPDMKGENYAPYAARLMLDKFEPGTYELRMLVIDRVAKTSAKRTLNFVVEP